ncbi:MAG: transposase [Candidatus Binatia bacterium]
MRTKLNEDWCYRALRQVRWPSGIGCPSCGQNRVTTHSKSNRTPRRRYLCLSCRRTFTDLTGSPFARTNLPLAKWFLCLRLTDCGLSTSALAKELGVKWDTSIHMQRRLGTPWGRPGLIRRLCQFIRVNRRE